MSQCLAVGLPVASACSGRGACGKCVMTVLSGASALEPPSARETAILLKNNAAMDQRLGCQCRTPGAAVELLITTGYW